MPAGLPFAIAATTPFAAHRSAVPRVHGCMSAPIGAHDPAAPSGLCQSSWVLALGVIRCARGDRCASPATTGLVVRLFRPQDHGIPARPADRPPAEVTPGPRYPLPQPA